MDQVLRRGKHGGQAKKILQSNPDEAMMEEMMSNLANQSIDLQLAQTDSHLSYMTDDFDKEDLD